MNKNGLLIKKKLTVEEKKKQIYTDWFSLYAYPLCQSVS